MLQRPHPDHMEVTCETTHVDLRAVLHMDNLCGRSCLDRDGTSTNAEIGRVEPSQGITWVYQQGNSTLEECSYGITMGQLAQ